MSKLQSLSIAGRRLAWREAGTGEPLVFVHGIGGYSASWLHQFAEFSHTYRVIAWDAPGYGGSEPFPNGKPSVGDYSAALAGLLERLDAASPHLVGHSVGAVMIANLCRHQAVTPRSVTFLHPVTGGGTLPPEQRDKVRRARIADLETLGPREFAVQRGRAILGRAATQSVVEEAIEVMAAVPMQGYLAAWEMMCEADIFADLDCIACPTLVLCGSDDPVSPPDTGRSIAKRIPGADCQVLQGIGHYGSIEAPGMLNPVLAQFLAACSRNARANKE